MKYRITIKLRADIGEKFPEYFEMESWTEPRLRRGFDKVLRLRNLAGDLFEFKQEHVVYVFSAATPVDEGAA